MFCNGITPRLADPDRIETAGLTLSSDSSCRVAVITDLCQASLLRAPPVRHHRQRGILSSRQNSVNRPPLPAALTHDPAQSGSFAGSPAFAAGAVKSRGAGGRRARDTRVEWGPWRGCREVSGTPVRSLDEPFPARTMPYGGILGPSWADHSSCSRKGSARSPRIRAESSQGAAQEVRMKRIAPRTPN
jgi:hypothetical protein